MANDQDGFAPADALRRVTAMGVIANAATLWAYLRARYAEAFAGRPEPPPARLPVDEPTFADWLDDYVDEAEAQRARLARALRAREMGG